jgi:hypothetical protein
MYKYLIILIGLSAGCHEHSDILDAIHAQQKRIHALEDTFETYRKEKELLEYRATCLLVDGKFHIQLIDTTHTCEHNGSWFSFDEVKAILHYNNRRIKDASNAD